jgi:hypothetical protein
LDQGGVEDIEGWCNSVPEPRLVLLDTLAGVRPTRSGIDSLYEGDYKALRDIHAFANERGMGVVALHHTRKMEADDPLDTISGSLGIAGAADTCLVLSRTSSGTTLYVRGRDVEEGEKAVAFDPVSCRWKILGEASEVQRSESRKEVMGALADAKDFISPGDIAAATSIARNNIDQLLHVMVRDGEVTKFARGKYCLPRNADQFAGALRTIRNKKEDPNH